MKTRSVSGRSDADVVWSGTLAAVIFGTRSPTHWRTCNDAQRTPSAPRNLNAPFAGVPKVVGPLIVKSAILTGESAQQ
jgi:hypothetical protein